MQGEMQDCVASRDKSWRKGLVLGGGNLKAEPLLISEDLGLAQPLQELLLPTRKLAQYLIFSLENRLGPALPPKFNADALMLPCWRGVLSHDVF